MTEYNITGARYAHSNRQGVLLETAEHGLVLAAPDMPQSNAWLDLQEWIKDGGVVRDWTPVEVPVEKTEIEELKEALIRKGVLLPEDLPMRVSNARG